MAKLRPDESQPRKIRSEEYLGRLAENIKKVGIINPIEITEDGIIITGESRWRAAQMAGLREVPVRVLDTEMVDITLRQMSENLHREAMNPIDTARQIAKTKSEKGWTFQEAADHFGIPLGTLKGYIALLGLPEFALDAVSRGKITWPTASAIVPLKDEGHIKWMIDECVKKRIRNTRVAQLIQRYLTQGGDFKKARDLVSKVPTEAQAYKLLDSEGFSAQVRSNLKRGNHMIDIATELMLALKAADVEDIPPIQVGRLALTLVALQKESDAFINRSKTKT